MRLAPEERSDAELLLAHVLGTPRSTLISHGERLAGPPQVAAFRALLARRSAGEPLAYLTGTREFWSLPLKVTPAVLIPRPETELLVERVLAAGRALSSRAGAAHPRMLDLGTGSGAVALAVASEAAGWAVTAVDRSPGALEVARDNARQLGLTRVEWLEGNWLEPVAGREFDVICSNPPYVAADDPALSALMHEPAAALIGGPDGLQALRAIIREAAAHLTPGGHLLLEHGAFQAAEVAAALVAAGYARVVCHRDLAGHDRVTEAQWGL